MQYSNNQFGKGCLLVTKIKKLSEDKTTRREKNGKTIKLRQESYMSQQCQMKNKNIELEDEREKSINPWKRGCQNYRVRFT